MRNSIGIANGGEEIVKTSEKKFITLFIILALLSGWIGLLFGLALPEQPGGQTLGMGIWLGLAGCFNACSRGCCPELPGV